MYTKNIMKPSITTYHKLFIVAIGLLLNLERAWPCNRPTGAVVVGSKDVSAEIVEQAKYYTQILGFDRQVYIMISVRPWLPQGIRGYTLYQDDRDRSGAQQAHIFLSKQLTLHQRGKTLAHEMIHVEQFISQRLIKCSRNHYRWEGGECRKISRIPYIIRAWEEEAVQRGNELYGYLHQQLKAGTTFQPKTALVKK